jgi:hydroxyacylglutathione hydrolase
VDFEAEGQLATYLAWLLPWGKPVTLLASSPEQLAAAQRELVRVGIDRPVAAATGSPGNWLREGESPRSFPRGTFADLARVHGVEGTVVLDVRRDSERAGGHVAGSLHIPVHRLRERLTEIPGGTIWVHCAGGMRAAIAASVLDAAGHRVVAVDDAFDNAAGAGLPMAETAGARTSAEHASRTRTSAERASESGRTGAAPAERGAPIDRRPVLPASASTGVPAE